MATILRMPEVLANATEAVVAAWTIAEGEAFSVGDTIAEIETEKALVDLAAEQAGILGRILAQPGDSTRVGAPIAVLIAADEGAAEIETLLGVALPAAATIPAPAVTPVTPRGLAATPTTRLFASPIARRRAREANLELERLHGTGPGGRIVRADVESAITARDGTETMQTAPVQGLDDLGADPKDASRSEPLPDSSGSGYLAIPHTGMRRAIARRLTESKSTVPHFYLTTECNVDELLRLRARINESAPVKISVNDLVVKAAAAAFTDVPDANVTWTDTHLRRWESVDIAVAVATDDGLFTPVVRGVQALSLSALSAGISELVGRARAGRLRQQELEGGSFSITNLGMYGTTEFSAILNPPQSGILAIGAAKPAPAIVAGELAVATIIRCTLSVDHRAIDGALAARWLAAFTSRIENPLTILV